jgi:hypothetical protein
MALTVLFPNSETVSGDVLTAGDFMMCFSIAGAFGSEADS